MARLRTGREWNFTVAVGGDLDFTHEIVDQDGEIVDLTDADIRCQVREHAGETAMDEFDVTVTELDDARVRLCLDDVDLDAGDYHYDEHVKLAADLDGYRADHYPLWGKITVVDSITPDAEDD